MQPDHLPGEVEVVRGGNDEPGRVLHLEGVLVVHVLGRQEVRGAVLDDFCLVQDSRGAGVGVAEVPLVPL